MKHFNHLVKLFFFLVSLRIRYIVSRGTESYQGIRWFDKDFFQAVCN